MLANHAKPVNTSTSPSRFGRPGCHDSSPLPINDQPTSTATGTASGASGTTGRPGPAMLTIQAAPAPASTPAAASHTSSARKATRIAANPYDPAGLSSLAGRSPP